MTATLRARIVAAMDRTRVARAGIAEALRRAEAGHRRPGIRVPCPQCGSDLDVEARAGKSRHGTRVVRVARVAFCAGCEFVHEF